MELISLLRHGNLSSSSSILFLVPSIGTRGRCSARSQLSLPCGGRRGGGGACESLAQVTTTDVATLTMTSSWDMYAAGYVRNCKAVGVLWAIFSICSAIIDLVAFVAPQWIGDSGHSRGTGHFGLWARCVLHSDGEELSCSGRLDDLAGIPSPAFRAATVFMALGVLLALLCLCQLLLFFFFKAATVFKVCACTQLVSAICLIIGVLCFPAGWDAAEVREVCGPRSRPYHPGDCSIRWSFILAIIGCFDAAVLSALAFVLATRYVLLSSCKESLNADSYKGEASSQSRKSMNLQPVLMMAASSVAGAPTDHDRYSQYSTAQGTRTKSVASAPYRGDPYASNYRL